MQPEKSPEDLQNFIYYNFTDLDILKRALTRRSHLEEIQCSLEEREDNMAPLATLGDAVLDLIIIHILYEKGLRDIGDLTESKINDIKKGKTRAVAEKHSYEKYVYWGTGEYQDKIWKSGDDTFDTCIEALVGAVYLDAFKKEKDPILTVSYVLLKLGFPLVE